MTIQPYSSSKQTLCSAMDVGEEHETVQMPSALASSNLTTLCSDCHANLPSYQQSLPPAVLNEFRHHTPSQFSHAEILAMSQPVLDRYDEEIQRAEGILSRLRWEREELHTYLMPHNAVFAPIRSVPNELLREIFIHLCSDNVLTTAALPPAMVIMQTCSHWFHIALSTKRMWNRFSISLPAGKPHIEQIVMLYLERSSDAPLHFNVNVNDGRLSARNAILERLVTQSHRWLSASFTIPSKLYPNLLPVKGKLPMLTTLGINRGNHDTSMFEDVPNLHTIVCHGFPNANLSIPWCQIRTFVFSRCWIGSASNTLSLCPNVSHVEFSSCFRFQKDVDPERYEVNLTSLTITSAETTGVWKPTGLTLLRGLLHGLTCPALETLDVDLPGPKAWSQQHVVEFLTRSGCNLTTFRLKNVAVTDRELEDILVLCPTLKTLVIAEPFNPETRSHIRMITNTFLDDLTLAYSVPSPPSCHSDIESDDTDTFSEPGSLLPNLQHLELSGGLSFDLCCLLRFIQSRTAAMQVNEDSRLESVRIRAHAIEAKEKVISRLREIRRGGFRLVIEVGDLESGIKDLL